MIAVTEESSSPTVSALWAAAMLFAGVSVLLIALAWPGLKATDAYPAGGIPVAAAVYATLGALIVRRVGNRIGWILLVLGLCIAILGITSLYAVVGIVTHPGSVPGGMAVGALSEVMFVPIVVGLAFMLLVFPTGSLPSRAWRPVAAVIVAVTLISIVGFFVGQRQVALPAPGGD